MQNSFMSGVDPEAAWNEWNGVMNYVGDVYGHDENNVLIELTAKSLIYKQAPY